MRFAYYPSLGVHCERHESWCRPGKWMVLIGMPAEIGECRFYPAVVDDFGNLVRVS